MKRIRLQPPEQKEQTAPACATGLSPLVLVNDEEPTMRKIVEFSLHREGYKQIHVFGDGGAALDWFLAQEGRVYEIARWFAHRPAFAQTHVVMLTRQTGVVDQLKARLAGAKGYLAKPFTTRQLLAMVESTIGKAPPQELGSIMSSVLPARSPFSNAYDGGEKQAPTEHMRAVLVLCPDHQ